MTPAAQTMVRAGMRVCVPLLSSTVMPRSSTITTFSSSQTSTPSLASCFAAPADSLVPNAPSTLSIASTSTMQVFMVSMVRKSFGSVRLASSAICPDISTPVAPAPTTAKVSHSVRSSSCCATSANSNAVRIRPRSSSASSIDFRPGAKRTKSSLPK